MGKIFRKEALENRGQRLWGEVIVVQPLSTAALTALLAAIVAVVLFALAFGTYARTEAAPGFLVPDRGVVSIHAPSTGVVSAISVEEGDRVEAGATLLSIVVEHPTLSGRSAEARSLSLIDEQLASLVQRRALERDLAGVERRRLEKELESLANELEALEAQRQLQDEIIASAKESFAALDQLVDRGFVLKAEYESRRQFYLAQEQQGRLLDQQIITLKGRLEAARLALEKLPSDLAERLARIESDIAALEQRKAEIESRQAYSITAPVAGRVTAMQASVGRVADPDVPLLVLLPEGGALEAELYVPSRAIGFVREGQEVRLLYDAFPYQRFGARSGVVTGVTRTILAPAEVSLPFALTEPAYRVKVALAEQTVDAFGEAVPLQPGMTLEARIVLERQSLLSWLLEPWRAIRSRS